MTSPGHKKVSHMGFFGLTNPTIFQLMYSTYLRVNRLRSARTTLSCRVGLVKTQKPVPYLGCMVMVCAICESCETAQHILQTLLRFHRLYNKISNDIKINTIRKKRIVLSYCLIFFPKLHKMRLSRNRCSQPSALREGFVKTLTI